MHSFEDSRVVVQWRGGQARERRHSVVDARVAWFAIHKI
jgi:hypothetical protein